MCLAVPGRIVEMGQNEGLPMGVVDFGGVKRDVCLAYVADDVEVGDYVFVHVGFAISVVDEEEARRTLQLLDEMSRLCETHGAADLARAGDGAGATGAP